MKEFKIPYLTAEDIECRPQQINVAKKGVSILLYKNARCDMRILDQTFGPLGWQREHYECKGNLFCKVGVKTEDGEWIWKSDCGTESNTEPEKGEASDSFKRACFNWGIGRELYTAPFIWINLDDSEIPNGKLTTKFKIKEISYTDGRISKFVIVDGKGKERFKMGESKAKAQEDTVQKNAKQDKISATLAAQIEDMCVSTKTEKKKLLDYFDVMAVTEMTPSQGERCMNMLISKTKRGSK